MDRIGPDGTTIRDAGGGSGSGDGVHGAVVDAGSTGPNHDGAPGGAIGGGRAGLGIFAGGPTTLVGGIVGQAPMPAGAPTGAASASPTATAVEAPHQPLPDLPVRGGILRRTAIRIIRALIVLAAALVAIALVLFLTGVIRERAADVGAAAAVASGPAPLAVATMVLPPPGPFRVEEGYVGRIEPRRESALAFERSGILDEVVVEEGDTVAAGDVVARLDVRDLDARARELSARRAANEADRELAELTLARTRQLSDRGHATDQALDADRIAVDRLTAVTAEIDAGLERIAIDLDKSVLRAPFDGHVAARLLDEGTIVAPGTPVVEILETARPQLRVGLPESRADGLVPGARVTVDHRGERIDGRVAAVRPDMDPSTQTVIALVDLPPTASASFGTLARLVTERSLVGEGWQVPLAALKEGRRGLWTLLTVRPPEAPGAPPTAGLETVEVLAVTDGNAFVRGTLGEGTEILVAGRHRVSRGDPILPRTADAGAEPDDARGLRFAVERD